MSKDKSPASSRLIVFAGKPGAGKSTLIKKLFQNHKTVDVLNFIRVYQENGKIIEETTKTGYEDLYRSLWELDDEIVIVEIGTNHVEFTLTELKKLEQKYYVHLFLCDVSKETAYSRLIERLEPDRDIKEIQERLNRNFPNSFLGVLKDRDLKHTILNMEKDIEKVAKDVLKELHF